METLTETISSLHVFNNTISSTSSSISLSSVTAVNISTSASSNADGGDGRSDVTLYRTDPVNIVGKVGAAVIVLLIALGVVGNLLVLIVIIQTRRLRRSYNVLIASLSVTDLIFNVLIMPFYVDSYIHRRWRYTDDLCRFETYFGTMTVMTTALHIGLIAANRYFLIVLPRWYPVVSSSRALVFQVGLAWMIALAVVLPGTFGWNAVVRYSDQIGRCNYVRAESRLSLYLVFNFGFICPCLIMCFCYVMIWNVTRKSRRTLAKHARGKSKRMPLPTSSDQALSLLVFKSSTSDMQSLQVSRAVIGEIETIQSSSETRRPIDLSDKSSNKSGEVEDIPSSAALNSGIYGTCLEALKVDSVSVMEACKGSTQSLLETTLPPFPTQLNAISRNQESNLEELSGHGISLALTPAEDNKPFPTFSNVTDQRTLSELFPEHSKKVFCLPNKPEPIVDHNSFLKIPTPKDVIQPPYSNVFPIAKSTKIKSKPIQKISISRISDEDRFRRAGNGIRRLIGAQSNCDVVQVNQATVNERTPDPFERTNVPLDGATYTQGNKKMIIAHDCRWAEDDFRRPERNDERHSASVDGHIFPFRFFFFLLKRNNALIDNGEHPQLPGRWKSTEANGRCCCCRKCHPLTEVALKESRNERVMMNDSRCTSFDMPRTISQPVLVVSDFNEDQGVSSSSGRASLQQSRPLPEVWTSKRHYDNSIFSGIIGEHSEATPARDSEKRNDVRNSKIPRMTTGSQRSVKMILVIFLAFILTYLPFTITNLADERSILHRNWYMITSLGFWAGSCVNPLIYGIMNRQFRAAYGSIVFRCRISKPGK